MTSAEWDQTEGTGAQQGGGEMERQRDMLGRGGSKKEEGGRQRDMGRGQDRWQCSTQMGHRAMDLLHTPWPPQSQGPLGNLWHLAWKASGMDSAFPQTSTLVTCHLWKQG